MNIKKIEKYLVENNKYEIYIAGKPGEPRHNRRYIESLNWIKSFLAANNEVLELGGKTVFTFVLERFFPVKIHEPPFFDLRRRFPLESNKYDLVLCMEVIEHVKDQETIEYVADFTASGIINMLAETYRVLKDSGKLFLTTPNVCSYKNFENLLKDSHPFFYELHQRELSIQDLRKYLTDAGFKIDRIESVNVWNNHDLDEQIRDKIRIMIESLGFSTEFRNDCLFALCSK